MRTRFKTSRLRANRRRLKMRSTQTLIQTMSRKRLQHVELQRPTHVRLRRERRARARTAMICEQAVNRLPPARGNSLRP